MSHRCLWSCLNCKQEFNQAINYNIKYDGICSTCRNPQEYPALQISEISEQILSSQVEYDDQEANLTEANLTEVNSTKIIFDKNTVNEWEVLFTTRGFVVGGTRMSFEEIRLAISKKYKFILKTGLILDSVKIMKILSYKDSIK